MSTRESTNKPTLNVTFRFRSSSHSNTFINIFSVAISLPPVPTSVRLEHRRWAGHQVIFYLISFDETGHSKKIAFLESAARGWFSKKKKPTQREMI